MPSRPNRYQGWIVCCQDLRQPRDRKFCRVRTKDEGDDIARRLNTIYPGRLYWCEWWKQNSGFSAINSGVGIDDVEERSRAG